ncbi:MAG: hypothetical protein FD123_1845 [Bacteroidetes bacterium]|nr:MAG: hypothetical protein FD123_1845 [Bacteroidota bacterium]
MPAKGEIVALLTTLSWSICMFPFTVAARKLGANVLNHLRLLMAVFLLTLILIIGFSFSPSDLFTAAGSRQWLWLGISGITGLTIGDYFAFRSMSLLGPRMSSVFSTMAPMAALFAGMALLDESLNLPGIAGMLITLAGVTWLGFSKNDPAVVHLSAKERWSGLLFAFLSPVCQGAGLAFARYGLEHGDTDAELLPIHAAWMRMCIATASLFLLSFFTGRFRSVYRQLHEKKGAGTGAAFLGTVFGPVAGVSLSMFAIALIPASVAQTIFSLVPVFVTVIAFAFWRERISWTSVIAMLVSVAGVILLVRRNDLGF